MKHLLLTTIAAVVLVGCGGPSGIYKAAAKGNIEAVKQHIAAGVDVNEKDQGGWASLHWAAGGGHKEVAELLISNGADVNAKHDDGLTPLDVAIGLEQPETANLLRNHGGKTKKELEAAGK